LGVAACKGGGAASAKLIPESATMIGGADLAALQKTEQWKGNKEMLEKGDQKEAMEAAKACNLGPDTWQSVVFGADPEGGDAKMAVVLVATGLGKKENLECISGKMKEKNDGEDPWTMEEKDGKLVLTIDEGEAIGYVVNENTLAVAGKDWAGAVKELVDGKGKPAIENSLKDVVGRTDMSKAVWAAGVIPESMAAGPADGMKDGAMWVDMSSGLELMASVGVKDADTATAKAKELSEQYDKMKGMAGGFGVPAAVTDSVKIEAKGGSVAVSAKASKDDLKKLSETAKKQMMGPGGAPGGAAAPN
jgi:hypothetical protein